MNGCLEEGSRPFLTQYDYFGGGEREKYGEVGRLPRTKCRRSIRHRWKTVVVSDSASRIRQNASMEIDRGGAISHENCKFEYFCHYTPDSITTRSIIYILEREGKKIIFLPSLLLLLCRIDLRNFFFLEKPLRRYRPRVTKLIPDTIWTMAIILNYAWNFIFGNIEIGNW